MQIAGVDMYVTYPVMVIGATDSVPASLAIDGSSAVGSGTHVVVRVEPRGGLVRVRLFNQANGERKLAPSFSTVFEGVLRLPRGRLVIGDGIGGSRFVKFLGRPGRWRARVAVDDPVRFARAVDVTVRREA